MTNPIYRIFISATYKDLKQERKEIMKTIVEAGNIPFGMELFPASNTSVCEIIEQQVKDCDFYVLIIGTQYGSIMPNSSISYTEWEYNLARNNEKPIILLIQDVDDSFYKTENKTLLTNFIKKLKETYTPCYFKTETELVKRYLLGLDKSIKTSSPRGVFAENNQAIITLQVLDSINPAFFYYFNNSTNSWAEPSIEEQLEDTKNRCIDSTHNLLDYWQRYLSSTNYSREGFLDSIETFAKPDFDEYETVITYMGVDQVSKDDLFRIFKALELINENYESTEYGKFIGKQISGFRIEKRKEQEKKRLAYFASFKHEKSNRKQDS